MNATKLSVVVTFAALSLVISACGGGGRGGSLPPNGSATPTVSPSTAPSTSAASIARVTLAVTGTPVLGVAGTFPLVVSAFDQHGNTIVGKYPSSITLTSSDRTGAVTLSATTITSSSATMTVTYNGKPLSAAVTIGANVSGVAQPTVSPASFAPDGTDPKISGSSLSYSVTSSTVTTFGTSTPEPVATSNTTMTVSISDDATFNGTSNLIDVHESYGVASTMYPATLDSYVEVSPSGAASSVLEIGSLAVVPAIMGSDTITTIYRSGYKIDSLPHVPSLTWNPADGQTMTDKFSEPGGIASTTQITRNADGSYSYSKETDNPGPVYVQSSTIGANLTGQTQWTTTYSGGSTTAWQYSIGVPTFQNGSSVIPLQATCSSPALSDCGAGTTGFLPSWSGTLYAADWYPSSPVPLDQEQFTALGTAAIPSSCAVPASVGTSADEVEYTQQLLDPLGTITSAKTDSYYVDGIGLACSISRTETKTFDWGDTGNLTEDQVISSITALGSFSIPQSRVAAERTSLIHAAAAIRPVIKALSLHDK